MQSDTKESAAVGETALPPDHGLRILEAACEAVWSVDLNGRTTYLNPTAARLVGWEAKQLIGKSQHDTLRHSHGDGRLYDPETCPLCEAYARGNNYRSGKNRFWKKDGTSFAVEYETAPIHDGDELIGSVLTFRDLTNEGIMQGQAMHAQKLESIGQLAAGIAHEINTPTQYVGDNTRFLKDAFADLNNLIGLCDQLLQAATKGELTDELIRQAKAAAKAADIEYLTEEIPKAIDQSLEGITRVTNIVRAMKDFSHPDSDSKVPTDLSHSIESTVTVARNEWKYLADICLDLDQTLPPVVCLPGDVNQVILNLVINAAHAIGEASNEGADGKGTITISTRAENGMAVISIADTGRGIPEHIQARIFDPFFTTKPVGKGTGQGLALAYSIVVEKHGGTIGFESEVGKGTKFIIQLPIDGNAMNEQGEPDAAADLAR